MTKTTSIPAPAATAATTLRPPFVSLAGSGAAALACLARPPSTVALGPRPAAGGGRTAGWPGPVTGKLSPLGAAPALTAPPATWLAPPPWLPGARPFPGLAPCAPGARPLRFRRARGSGLAASPTGSPGDVPAPRASVTSPGEGTGAARRSLSRSSKSSSKEYGSAGPAWPALIPCSSSPTRSATPVRQTSR